MKILWITNTLFPEVQALIAGQGELKGSGGWMIASAEKLIQQEDVILSVATVSHLVKDLKVVEGKGILYYILPLGKGNLKENPEYDKYWQKVKKDFLPDVVHIHGTEFSHGLSYINACGNQSVVVSLQGLKSRIASYYCAGITRKEILRNITFRDLIKGTIFSEQKKFEESGRTIEKSMLSQVKHIIGRTSWDRAHAWAINPNAKYHFCNETLRLEFYDGSKWNYDKCEKHTIFLSQAGYPLKGLHQVLSAMPLILRDYPNAKIKVAGNDITKYKSLREKIRISGYGMHIRRLIHKMHLENHIEFLGPLNAEQMKQAYLDCNVFICPSSIENSPNSLGEAQLLGIPHVASYVGGVADMMVGNEENLYRFEETEMLAEKVCRIFANEDKQIDMSDVALQRHNRDENLNQLLTIYNEIK
jgi:glycosyltransferase involved in cell wall biosynthesis